MEQQEFYIVFAIVGMAIVGIVFWAATYSSRNDYEDYYRGRGGYPPPYPQYPPYPPQYPPRQESSFFTILALGLVVFLLFAGMQYCGRTVEQDRLEHIYQEDDNIVEQEDRSLSQTNIYSGDAIYDEIEYNLPESYDTTQEPVYQSVAPPIPLAEGYFCQNSASNDSEQILQDAQKLEATFQGRVFIGIVDDGTGFPYKLLIGPYDTKVAAQSVHGRGSIIYRPADKDVQINNPR